MLGLGQGYKYCTHPTTARRPGSNPSSALKTSSLVAGASQSRQYGQESLLLGGSGTDDRRTFLAGTQLVISAHDSEVEDLRASYNIFISASSSLCPDLVSYFSLRLGDLLAARIVDQSSVSCNIRPDSQTL